MIVDIYSNKNLPFFCHGNHKIWRITANVDYFGDLRENNKKGA